MRIAFGSDDENETTRAVLAELRERGDVEVVETDPEEAAAIKRLDEL